MKLVFAIINKDDALELAGALTEYGFSSTRIDSTGGFLMMGNTTFLIGVDEERTRDVIAIIRGKCHSRLQSAPLDDDAVAVGGATIFVVDIEHFERV